MATPSSTPGSPEDGAASVMAEWAPEAESLALTVGGDFSQQSAGAENELRVTDTIEFNFVVRPPLTAPPPPPDPIASQLTAWTFGGLLLFLLGNGALLARQFFSPAPATPLEQLSSLPPWQEASLLSQANLAPETSLGLDTLSAVPPPLPAKPKPSPPVAVAPRLTAPPPPPQSWSQPLAARLLAPPAPVQAPAPPPPLPTLAVRPANLTPPPPPPNPIEGNPPLNLLQGPVTQEIPPAAPPSLEQVRQQLQPQLEPSPALSFNAQTRQRLLKMQNPALPNAAPSPAPADITEMDRTQQLIQELESLNQAP